jgi:two-component system sensor histidine kinase TctE
MLSTDADDRVFYRIADGGGGLLTGYADLPQPPEHTSSEANGPIFYDATYRGETVRVGALTQPITGLGASGRLSVQVAQTRGQRDQLVRELASATAARLLVLLALIAVAIWSGVRFGLAPLAQLRATVRARSPRDLRPFDIAVPAEVRDVVVAINSHMARLLQTRNAMEQFISDAAHQLRTPLAALHTHVELALREADPQALRASVLELKDSTWRTSRLARQLLNLARTSVEAPSRV